MKKFLTCLPVLSITHDFQKCHPDHFSLIRQVDIYYRSDWCWFWKVSTFTSFFSRRSCRFWSFDESSLVFGCVNSWSSSSESRVARVLRPYYRCTHHVCILCLYFALIVSAFCFKLNFEHIPELQKYLNYTWPKFLRWTSVLPVQPYLQSFSNIIVVNYDSCEGVTGCVQVWNFVKKNI